MKIKSKLILAATSLLVLSGVAAGTSTYAWYTANRQVELEVTNVSATSQLSNLEMTYDTEKNTRNDETSGKDPFTTDETSTASSIKGTFSKTLTDVSSKGDNSYLKPIFDATGKNSVGFWTDDDEEDYTQSPNASKDVFYHRMAFSFNISGDGIPVALYLSPNSQVLENLDDDDDSLTVADAVRFSVSTIDDSDVETEVLYANPNGDDENTYLADTTPITDSTVPDVVSGDDLGILENNGFFHKGNNYTESEMYKGSGTIPDGGTLYTDRNAGFIKDIADPSTEGDFDIAVDIWIEGTDDDCVDDLTDTDYFGKFDLQLEFYTLVTGAMGATD
ncbi:MAG: hypothetical protein WCR63_04280 [Bacilli bacterium]